MEKKQHSALFVTSLIYFIILTLFIAVRIVVQFINVSMSVEVLDVIINSVIQIGFMFLLPVFLFSAIQKQKVKKTLIFIE